MSISRLTDMLALYGQLQGSKCHEIRNVKVTTKKRENHVNMAPILKHFYDSFCEYRAMAELQRLSSVPNKQNEVPSLMTKCALISSISSPLS